MTAISLPLPNDTRPMRFGRLMSGLLLGSMAIGQAANHLPITQTDTRQPIAIEGTTAEYTTLGEKVLIIGGGVLALYWANQNNLINWPDIPSYEVGGAQDESINVRVNNTVVYENDLIIPLTVVSEVGVEVRENEAGIFDGFPFIDGGPPLATQKVDINGIGDVDIAIDGRLRIYRDDINQRLVHVHIDTFKTWRPRLLMESLEFNPDGDEYSGWRSELRSATRDRATRAALVALQAIVAHEGCRAASQALIEEEIVEGVVERILQRSDVQNTIHYNPEGGDRYKLHLTEPVAEDPLADFEEFASYYIDNQRPANDPQPPQLGENAALELLTALAKEVDELRIIDGAGESLSVDDLVARQKICEQGIPNEIVSISVHQNGEEFIGQREDLLGSNQPVGVEP